MFFCISTFFSKLRWFIIFCVLHFTVIMLLIQQPNDCYGFMPQSYHLFFNIQNILTKNFFFNKKCYFTCSINSSTSSSVVAQEVTKRTVVSFFPGIPQSSKETPFSRKSSTTSLGNTKNCWFVGESIATR